MQTNNTGGSDNQQQQNSAQSNMDAKQKQDEKQTVAAAHDQAEADIEKDPDLGATNDPAADLDEGEIAKLDNNHDNVDV